MGERDNGKCLLRRKKCFCKINKNYEGSSHIFTVTRQNVGSRMQLIAFTLNILGVYWPKIKFKLTNK